MKFIGMYGYIGHGSYIMEPEHNALGTLIVLWAE